MPQSVRFGLIVIAPNSVAARTVIAAVAVLPTESATVSVTAVSALTFAARSGIAPPLTACVIGRTAGLLENAVYGGTPPVTNTDVATPEKMVRELGSKASVGAGVVDSGCTSTPTVAVCPAESWTVTTTLVSAATLLGTRMIEVPATA